MQIDICENYPSLSPFDIRKQRFSEVFLLVRRLNNNKSKKGNNAHYKDVDGKKRYYVPVQN